VFGVFRLRGVCDTAVVNETLLLLIFLVLPILAYVSAGLLLALRAVRGDTPGREMALPLALIAIVLHAGWHLHGWHVTGGPDMHFFAALSLVALGMAALTAAMTFMRRLQALGIVVYPLAALMLAFAVGYGHVRAEPLDWRLQLHAWLALLAFATLAIAALLAVLLWLQERALQRRELGGWLRALPPLVQLETLLFRTIAAGFALLTLALITGVVFVDNLMEQHLVQKTVLSVLSWLVFGWLLVGRWRYGWRGPRAVKFTLSAMALLLLAFFGSKFVLELILHRTN
jgi:ABC-type uncharacterized transport system permease subunit